MKLIFLILIPAWTRMSPWGSCPSLPCLEWVSDMNTILTTLLPLATWLLCSPDFFSIFLLPRLLLNLLEVDNKQLIWCFTGFMSFIPLWVMLLCNFSNLIAINYMTRKVFLNQSNHKYLEMSKFLTTNNEMFHLADNISPLPHQKHGHNVVCIIFQNY